MDIMSTLEDQIANKLAAEMANTIDQEIMMELMSNWPDSLYAGGKIGPNLPEGWAGEWSILVTHSAPGWELWSSMVRWIRDSIHNPEENAYWVYNIGRIRVYVRRPQDLTAFLLRWS
jgi:hypothetical protein